MKIFGPLKFRIDLDLIYEFFEEFLPLWEWDSKVVGHRCYGIA